MSTSSSSEEFGCGRCWPPAPDAAWAARALLTHAAALVDESHFIVNILQCPSCTQRFVSIFTEDVDWVDSEDPQFWRLIPITATEAQGLAQQGGSLTEGQVIAVGTGRRVLRRDYPKGAEPRVYWGGGA